MKAKVKATGEIIDVSQTENIITSRGVEKQYVDNKREWCTYVQSELEIINEEPQRNIEWEHRRYELVIETVRSLSQGLDSFPCKEVSHQMAQRIMVFVDTLISELKQKVGNGTDKRNS